MGWQLHRGFLNALDGDGPGTQQPSARTWYRAHNASIVAAYLDHRDLAEAETHPERFFLNLILVRVLFAHAVVERQNPATGWMAREARSVLPAPGHQR